MMYIHALLLAILVLNNFFVYFSMNPVHSVLFLILAFINASFILILFQIEFLAMLFIIVYVGAIAVLFLFIVMMLNIKKVRINSSFFNRSLFLSVLVSLFFFLQFHKFFNFFRDDNDISKYNYNMVSTDHFSDILLFGQSLYNYNLVIVLLSGLLLLVAMVGAIVLTLDFRATNFIELSERQLARSANTLKLYK